MTELRFISLLPGKRFFEKTRGFLNEICLISGSVYQTTTFGVQSVLQDTAGHQGTFRDGVRTIFPSPPDFGDIRMDRIRTVKALSAFAAYVLLSTQPCFCAEAPAPDRDGDGFSDAREQLDGTDPASADSFGANGLQGVADGRPVPGWFRVYAPRAAGAEHGAVSVCCSADGWKTRHPLVRETGADGSPTGYWNGSAAGVRAGAEYKFVITSAEIDGEKWVNDPRARLFSVGTNNSLVCDPAAFVWKRGNFSDSSFKPPKLGELMVYEIHAGNMTLNDGRYGTFADLCDTTKGVDADGDGKPDLSKIDWIRSLGFNAVEIMPVVECATRPYTLGFNPLTFFTLNRDYVGSARDADAFRHFVMFCHQRGLAVVLDVNVNHLDDNYFPDDRSEAATARGKARNYTSPLVQFDYQNHPDQPNHDLGWMFPPFDPSRPDDQWFDTNWGPSANLTGQTAQGVDAALKAANQAYALDSLRMWVNEYHVDGLRFDAVHAIGGRRAKGLEGKEFIARFAKEIRKREPDFILFSENHLSVRAMQDQLGMSANWPNPEGWERGRDDEFAVFPDLAAPDMKEGDLQSGVEGVMFHHFQKHDVNPWTSAKPDPFARYPSLSSFSSHNSNNNLGSSYRRISAARPDMPEEWKRKRCAIVQSMAFLGTAIPYSFMGEEFMNCRYRAEGRGNPGNEKDWDDSAAIPWEFAAERRNLTNMWRSLTRLRRSLPALGITLPRDTDVFHETLRPVDTRNDVVVIHRRNDEGAGMLIVIRFGTGAAFERSYQIGCPASGTWREVFSTAWFEPEKNLGGEPQIPNANTYTTTEEPSHGKPCSLRISLPAHSLVVLAAP